jgi:hypothetical protein
MKFETTEFIDYAFGNHVMLKLLQDCISNYVLLLRIHKVKICKKIKNLLHNLTNELILFTKQRNTIKTKRINKKLFR